MSMFGTGYMVADDDTERWHIHTVVLVIDHEYQRVLVIGAPDYDPLDYASALMELNFRAGKVPALKGPVWDTTDQVWTWEANY